MAVKRLAIGYFLSAFNALVFIPLFTLYVLYPSLVTYPISIVLRGLGWLGLRQRLGFLGYSYIALWTLGIITFISLILSLSETFKPAIFIAVAAWTFYSIFEAMLYIVAARNLGTMVFYISPVSLVGVASTTILVLTLSPVGALPHGGVSGVWGSLLYVAGISLFISATSSATASLRISSPHPLQPPSPSRSSLLQTTHLRTPAQEKPIAGRPMQGPLIQIQVLSLGNALICSGCGTASPLTALTCISCGISFKKAETGLRCPVCKAPFSMASRIGERNFVCGQCFSDLIIQQK
ncbi:MAG: zinc ribbon domain-containing protein [Nitrososphaerota archaeon]